MVSKELINEEGIYIKRREGMRKLRSKMLSFIVVITLFVSITGCSQKDEKVNKVEDDKQVVTEKPTEVPEKPTEEPTEEPTEKPVVTIAPFKETRTITVGTWWDVYYTSDHDDVTDNPNVSNVEIAQMQLDNVRAIEKKYNCKIVFKNLTWKGAKDSINTSIAAGKPECDIYTTDPQWGIPAVLNGYAQALEDFLPADSDVFTEQKIVKNLAIFDSDKSYLFCESKPNTTADLLGFNKKMIDEAGLENPQDLYDRGEWTWDTFRDYLKVLNKDTNGDGQTDVYGYGGAWTLAFNQLLLSNGTSVCGSKKQTLDSPATLEVLELFYNLYNVDKTAKPWNPENWNDNVTAFSKGQCAFFVDSLWVTQSFMPEDADWELGMVPWPIGPSGDQKTNALMPVDGNYYMVPIGIKEPEAVFNVLYDWLNWFNFDTELRDDDEYTQIWSKTERNMNYLYEASERQLLDLWNYSGTRIDMNSIMNGGKTPSQVAEEYKAVYQDFLDQYFK